MVGSKTRTRLFAKPPVPDGGEKGWKEKYAMDVPNLIATSRMLFSEWDHYYYWEGNTRIERGEWVNGLRIPDRCWAPRAYHPFHTIPITRHFINQSTLLWDVVYSLPSWNLDVYDDRFLYACHVFPPHTDHLWWDWRWSLSIHMALLWKDSVGGGVRQMNFTALVLSRLWGGCTGATIGVFLLATTMFI